MRDVTRWTPFEDMLSLRDAVGQLLEDSVVRPASRSTSGALMPALDLAESSDAYYVELSVPGFTPENLDITVQENVLTVSGEIKQQEQRQDRTYHRVERRHGSFTRSVTFPTNIKADAISASCSNGILSIEIPKAEEVKPRKISVQIGEGNKTLEAGR